MQYNIFKITDRKSLLEAMTEREYKIKGHEITSGDYKLLLYCKYDDDQKISWKSVFDAFQETDIPNKSGLSSIVVCQNSADNNVFAITYGSSSFLAQKFCDREFGFNFAKRIELDELKRKSSVTSSSNKNSSITSFKNTKTIVYDSGENITSLSFTPKDEEYGNRIDIGKSIRFNLELPFNNIDRLLTKILTDLKREEINKIPLLLEVKNIDEINEYTDKLYDDFRTQLELYKKKDFCNNNSIDTNEFTIVGCDFFFENEETKSIKIGRNELEIDYLDMSKIFEICIRYQIDIQQLMETGKIIYQDESNQTIYSESLKTHINYEIYGKNVCFYDSRWYEYNNDYLELIKQEVNTINVEYRKEDNMAKNDLKDKEGLYREEKINIILSNKYKGKLLDRDCLLLKYDDEFGHNDYKIEIADLIIDNTYFSLKIGDAKSLSYCIDQSLLSANLINSNIIQLEKYRNSDISKYGLWFYLEKQRFFNDKINLLKLNSVMLISKLAIWSKQIKSLGKEPIIYISKYQK